MRFIDIFKTNLISKINLDALKLIPFEKII